MASSKQNVNYFILYGNSDICGCLSLHLLCSLSIFDFLVCHTAQPEKKTRTLSVIAELHEQRAQVLENYQSVRARECHKVPNTMDKTNNKSSVARDGKQRTRNKCTKFDWINSMAFFVKRWSEKSVYQGYLFV